MTHHSPPGLRLGSVCTGYGGLDAAVQAVFGGTLAWVADNDPGAARILAHHYPHVPNLGDITAIDWADVPPVDVVLGGYPCQPFSTAGKRKGTADARHIWPYIADALRVLRPRLAIFENVANHLRLGFDTVLADLARLGFDAQWCIAAASEVGAAHERKRLFLLSWPADADPADLGHEWGRGARDGGPGSADGRFTVADAFGFVPGYDGELPPGRDALRRRLRDDAPRCGAALADADSLGRRADVLDLRPGQPDLDWGCYEPAIRRWERILGRPAPWPTDLRGRLSVVFTEWHMGLPDGWVTAVPDLSRNAMGKALGNGVVPQQAQAALRSLTDRLAARHTASVA
jgi:DNA (cytosine-5)-methyltransferase 1